jgi:hypothetical protein
MRCRKARKDISRSIDGELSAREGARLGRHLAACGECRTLQADLRKIVAEASALAAPEPSGKAWLAIRAGLEAGKAGPAAETASPDRRPLFGLGVPALRFAGAAALALVLVLAGLVLGRRLGRERAGLGPNAGEAYTLAKLDEAERYYEQAIKSLSEAFASGKAALPPEVVEMFERNAQVIDATIQACRQAVLEEPGDFEARNYLMAAYTRKLTLLDSALDLQRGAREPGIGKAII